jgi:serine protease
MPYVMNVGASCGAGFVNSPGPLDGYSIVEGHEYAETITDQNPAGGWTNRRSGQENGDECAWISSGQGASANVTTGRGTFAMQSTWSNDTNRCDISHPTIT